MRKLKAFGQHFLVDQQVLQTINSHIKISKEPLIEIGPGGGALTDLLVQKKQHFQVIEADKRWCEFLKKRHPNVLTVVHLDALQFDWHTIDAETIIVGNLPYQIASELMVRLAQSGAPFKYCLFMMQKEVALRALAPIGASAYGRLSVILRTQFDMEEVMHVPPDAFDPPPKVDSSVLMITRKKEPLCSVSELPAIEALTQSLFSQRRKKCRKILLQQFHQAQIDRLSINLDARPQALAPEIYVELVRLSEENNR